ncbi:hypothetical protein B566_EDAN017747 [Ephemera danica]|nr:hypothetical protein B566_EDAN017747 [Ephemera danica]
MRVRLGVFISSRRCWVAALGRLSTVQGMHPSCSSSDQRRRAFAGMLQGDEATTGDIPRDNSVDPFDDEAAEDAFSGLGLSTETDEERLTALLADIFACRDSPLSNWIVESKVRLLCAEYKCLLSPHRTGLLRTLAERFAVDHTRAQEAAKALIEGAEDHRASVRGEERLRGVLTPSYHWLFMHVGRLEGGIKFLVDMRTDVLDLLSELGVGEEGLAADVQQLNSTLRDLLSMWFSVGFLRLERVTWQSPCDLLQKVSDYEAVHPVRGWADLKRRVGPYRRCFMFTHDSMPREPIVVLHTALADTISASMRGIVSAQQRLSVDAGAAGGLAALLAADTENPDLVKAAIFYSITSTQRGLQGIELGNYLIKRVVTELRAEFPLVSMFSSLSPIPHFRTWLLERLKAVDRGEASISSVFTEGELGALQRHLEATEVPSAAALRTLLAGNDWLQDHALVQAMEAPLMRLCARYLFLEKRRGFALDSVANFHLRNGAVMWRLNWRADTSPRGLGNSLGIMVNYRYFLEDAETNSRGYLESQRIAASEQVLKLAEQARGLLSPS